MDEHWWETFSRKLGYDVSLYIDKDPMTWPDDLKKMYADWYAEVISS